LTTRNRLVAKVAVYNIVVQISVDGVVALASIRAGFENLNRAISGVSA
jgi:hypothetical protein